MAGDRERPKRTGESEEPLRPRTVSPRRASTRPTPPSRPRDREADGGREADGRGRPAAVPPRAAALGPAGARRRPESTAKVRIPAELASAPLGETRPTDGGGAGSDDVPPSRAVGGAAPPPRSNRRLILAIVAVLILIVGLGYVAISQTGDDDNDTATGPSFTVADDEPEGDDPDDPDPEPESTTPSGLAEESDYDGWVDPETFSEPWSSEVLGLLTFRGNPTRSYHGLGPVPEDPEILWEKPDEGGWCGPSTVGGETKTWCGTGWTGQPSVWDNDGETHVAIGAYDHQVHMLDAEDGSDVRAPYDFGDIIKGSVTIDPDGYPLIYSGSRADFHILATDREEGLDSLWSMNANNVPEPKWNDDWDSSPLVIDDYLFEGGENGWWYVVKLNREMGDDDKVSVDPEVVFSARGWDDEQLSDLAGSGARVNDVSIENSLAISGDTVYFTNSGGLVQGWDISGLDDGEDPERVFRFWAGDDIDASVVVDDEGMLYVGQQYERPSTRERSEEIGQLFKLDPSDPDDPLVWSVHDMDTLPAGIWATPAVVDGVVIAPTNSGRIFGVDQDTGDVLWEKELQGPTWSSPVVVDDVWIQGDCGGMLRGFDFSDPRSEPSKLWEIELEGCVESTPAVFDGQIFVGARGGRFYAIGDPEG